MKGLLVGGLHAALLLFPSALIAQLSVLNGLSHYHPCSGALSGEIWLQNEGDSAITVLVDHEVRLGKTEDLLIPSEIQLRGHERRALNFTWNTKDSFAHHALVEVYALPILPVKHESTWTVVTEIHFLLNLYRGCLEESPSTTITVQRDSNLICTYTGTRIWKALAQPYTSIGHPIGPAIPLFFLPGKIHTINPPHQCAYILLEDDLGQTIGIPWRNHAH
jgi:hypothetical protein